MKKLLEAFRNVPTQANRDKLQKYLDKHMMAICMAMPEDVAFLKENQFRIWYELNRSSRSNQLHD